MKKRFVLFSVMTLCLMLTTSACNDSPAADRDETSTTAESTETEKPKAGTETESAETAAETTSETSTEDFEDVIERDLENVIESIEESVAYENQLKEEYQHWYDLLQEDKSTADQYIMDTSKREASSELQNGMDEIFMYLVKNMQELNKENADRARDKEEIDDRYTDYPQEYERYLRDLIEKMNILHEQYKEQFSLYQNALSELPDLSRVDGKFELNDFVRMASWSPADFIEEYGSPDEESEELIKFDYISFFDHPGHLRVFLDKNGEKNCISWTSYISSEKLYSELFERIRYHGNPGNTREPREGQIEEGTYIEGVEVFAGYEDSSNGQYTYVFAEYPNRD